VMGKKGEDGNILLLPLFGEEERGGEEKAGRIPLLIGGRRGKGSVEWERRRKTLLPHPGEKGVLGARSLLGSGPRKGEKHGESLHNFSATRKGRGGGKKSGAHGTTGFLVGEKIKGLGGKKEKIRKRITIYQYLSSR